MRFVSGNVSRAKSSLYWSVILYQITLGDILDVVRKRLIALFDILFIMTDSLSYYMKIC